MNITTVWKRWLLLCAVSSPREIPSRVSIKAELFSVLMEGAARVVDSWKLPSPEEILSRSQTPPSPLSYMEEVGNELHLFAERDGMRYEDGRFIESWPARMIESRRFNCAGASMLGTYYLEEYIKLTNVHCHPFIGILPGHSVLLLHQKGCWELIDLMNRQYEVLGELKEFSERGRNYLISPQSWTAFAPLRDICGNVLGNVTGAVSLVKEPWISREDKSVIQDYIERHPILYSDDDLKVFLELIYNDTIVPPPSL